MTSKLIAIAGTHGKSTSTAIAMVVWLFKCLGVPLSYSIRAKIGFADMASYNKQAEFLFAYEADEIDYNSKLRTVHKYYCRR